MGFGVVAGLGCALDIATVKSGLAAYRFVAKRFTAGGLSAKRFAPRGSTSWAWFAAAGGVGLTWLRERFAKRLAGWLVITPSKGAVVTFGERFGK